MALLITERRRHPERLQQAGGHGDKNGAEEEWRRSRVCERGRSNAPYAESAGPHEVQREVRAKSPAHTK